MGAACTRPTGDAPPHKPAPRLSQKLVPHPLELGVLVLGNECLNGEDEVWPSVGHIVGAPIWLTPSCPSSSGRRPGLHAACAPPQAQVEATAEGKPAAESAAGGGF